MKDVERAAERGDLNSEELRLRAVRLINEVADDKGATRREKLSAGKALLAVAKAQQQIEESRPAKSGRARAVELAEQLGLTHALEAVPEGDPRAGFSDAEPAEDDASRERRAEKAGPEKREQPDSDSTSSELEPARAMPGGS